MSEPKVACIILTNDLYEEFYVLSKALPLHSISRALLHSHPRWKLQS